MMKWDESYRIGIETIDKQHQMLFRMSEDFFLSLEAGRCERTFGFFLDFLTKYSNEHFSFEERCMEKYRCPVAAKNKEAHEKFRVVVDEIHRKYKERGFDNSDARRLAEYLNNWFSSHICTVDIHLKDCVK